jgi:hypothetical protein
MPWALASRMSLSIGCTSRNTKVRRAATLKLRKRQGQLTVRTDNEFRVRFAPQRK